MESVINHFPKEQKAWIGGGISRVGGTGVFGVGELPALVSHAYVLAQNVENGKRGGCRLIDNSADAATACAAGHRAGIARDKPTGGLQIGAAQSIFSVGRTAEGKLWSSFGQEE